MPLSLFDFYAIGCVTTAIYLLWQVVIVLRPSAKGSVKDALKDLQVFSAWERNLIIGLAFFIVLVVFPISWPVSMPYVYLRSR